MLQRRKLLVADQVVVNEPKSNHLTDHGRRRHENTELHFQKGLSNEYGIPQNAGLSHKYGTNFTPIYS